MSTLSNPDWVMYGPYTSHSSACSALQSVGASCYVAEYCSSCPDSGWYALRSYSPETAYYYTGGCTIDGTTNSENDSDGDGIPNVVDVCSNTSPSASGYTDNQGCSPLQYAEVKDTYNGQDSNIFKASCGKEKIGDPISILNGNNWGSQTDIRFNSAFANGLVFERFYNSQDSNDTAMGYGWRHSFHLTLTPNFNGDSELIKILDESGRGHYFQDYDQDSVYVDESSIQSTVSKDGDGNYVWQRGDGRTYTFSVTTNPENDSDCSTSSSENLSVIMSTLSNPDWVMYGPYTSQSSACSALQSVGASCYVAEYCSSCPDSGWYALRSYSPETAYYYTGECAIDGTTVRLLTISDPHGNTLNLSYDSNSLLETITDQASGRSLTFHYNSDNRISYITGPVTTAVADGIWVSYEYDDTGNLTKAIYADGNNGSTASGFEYRYEDANDPNNMTAKYDLAGHLIASWSYDDEDRAVENVTREGSGASINFDDPENVVVTDAYELSNTYTISEVAGQEKITAKTGASNCNVCSSGIVRTEFDNSTGLPKEREWANGRIDQYQDYDSNNNLGTWIISAGTDEEKKITTVWHPVLSAPLSRTQKSLLADDDNPNRTRVMIWDYDDPSADGDTDTPNENPTNLIYRMILQGFTHNDSGAVIELEQITTYTYNDKGQVLSVNGPLDGDEDTVSFSYDPSTGDLLTMTRPLTGTIIFTYDAAGNMLTVTDENGIQTSVTYDGRNRWLTETSNNASTTRTFNTAGELAGLTDRAGIALSLSYNTKGFLQTVSDPSGNYMSHTYDENGNPVESSIYTAQGVQALYSGWDYGDPATDPGLAPGKPAKALAKNQDNTVDLETLFAYENGNLVQITDPLSAVKNFTYDSLNRVVLSGEEQSATVTAETGYAYDINNNLIQVTDPEGRITAYTYDDANRLIKEVSPDSGTTTYLYDDAGNLTTKTTGDGAVVQYTHDVLGRMLTKEYSDTGLDVIFSYDEGDNGMGRLTGINNDRDVYAFSYDASGNLVTVQRTTDEVTYVTTYSYDADGRLTGMVYPDGRIVTYTLDTNGRVVSVTTEKDGTTQTLASSISYRPFGPVASMTLGTGQQAATIFDLNYRPVTMNTGEIIDYAFDYDAVGQIAAITDNLDSDRARGFGYDLAGRLITATGPFGSLSFTYDKTGNRLTRTLDGVVQTYTYTTGTNKLTQITDADGSTALTYDSVGKVLTKGDLSFEYTDAGRMLKTLNQGTQVQESVYNSFGLRTRKTAGGVTRLYHYDLSGRLIAESATNGTIIREYIYLDNQPLAMILSEGALAAQIDLDADNDVDGADLALSLDTDPALMASVFGFGQIYNNDSESIYYYQNDHLGSPAKILNKSGEVVWDGDYAPFGQVDVSVGNVQNLLRFPGQYVPLRPKQSHQLC